MEKLTCKNCPLYFKEEDEGFPFCHYEGSEKHLLCNDDLEETEEE